MYCNIVSIQNMNYEYMQAYNRLIENNKYAEAKNVLEPPSSKINSYTSESFTKYEAYLVNLLNQLDIEA